jgi:hypothetical protein
MSELRRLRWRRELEHERRLVEYERRRVEHQQWLPERFRRDRKCVKWDRLRRWWFRRDV